MTAVQPFLAGFEAEERRRDLSQFYTNPRVAGRLWQWACPANSRRLRVLEPAAGRGSLIIPMLTDPTRPKPSLVVAYEVDPENVAVLQALAQHHPELDVRGRDFLADPNPGQFDLCVQNPPFENDQDVRFVMRALAASRRCVALLRADVEHGVNRWDSLMRRVEQRRKVNFVGRPQFGGEYKPMTDFKIFDLYARSRPLEFEEPTTVNQEWWR